MYTERPGGQFLSFFDLLGVPKFHREQREAPSLRSAGLLVTTSPVLHSSAAPRSRRPFLSDGCFWSECGYARLRALPAYCNLPTAVLSLRLGFDLADLQNQSRYGYEDGNEGDSQAFAADV